MLASEPWSNPSIGFRVFTPWTTTSFKKSTCRVTLNFQTISALLLVTIPAEFQVHERFFFFSFFITLGLEMSDAKVYEP